MGRRRASASSGDPGGPSCLPPHERGNLGPPRLPSPPSEASTRSGPPHCPPTHSRAGAEGGGDQGQCQGPAATLRALCTATWADRAGLGPGLGLGRMRLGERVGAVTHTSGRGDTGSIPGGAAVLAVGPRGQRPGPGSMQPLPGPESSTTSGVRQPRGPRRPQTAKQEPPEWRPEGGVGPLERFPWRVTLRVPSVLRILPSVTSSRERVYL